MKVNLGWPTAMVSPRPSVGFPYRVLILFVFVAAGLSGTLPEATAAQDVLHRGRDVGIQPPDWIVEQLRRDPTSFTFKRGWKEKVRQIRERRRALQRPGGLQQGPTDNPQQGPAVTGTYRIPVIPALYSDVTAPHSQVELTERIFGNAPGAVSVSKLYEEMSGGAFNFAGFVNPWQSMPQNRAYYEDGTQYGRLWDFLRDALTSADLVENFGAYDNDGPDGVPNSGDDDGFVDTAAFLYPTVSTTCLTPGTGIWPHRWTVEAARVFRGDGLLQPFTTNDPRAGGGFIAVSDYIIQSSVNCNVNQLLGTGTLSHELGHALDLPDLYDTNPNDGSNSSGIGHWGLMGSGNHNTQLSPAHMSAWSKADLGWLTVSSVTTQQAGVSLPNIQQSFQVLRLNIPGTTEYFLLSNRQPFFSDAHLPGPGLLVWHIVPDLIASTRALNSVNALVDFKGVDLEEADGLKALDTAISNGDAGDPFPGYFEVTEFSPGSNPSSESYTGSFCKVALRNIQLVQSEILMDIYPSHRTAFWGDTDGDGALVDGEELAAFNHALGYRDPSGAPTYAINGDVDGDGDVDIRDAFMIQSHFDGVPVPGSRINTSDWVECTLDPQPSGLGPISGELGPGGH